MKAVVAMAAASIASVLVVGILVDPRARLAVLLGMLGPLLMAGGSWVLAERTYRERPQALMSVMIAAFAFKLVFFGAYVGLAIGVLRVQPVPFIVSFTTCFIALHLIEAFWMKRLFVS